MIDIINLMVENGIVVSRAEGRRVIHSGAVVQNEDVIKAGDVISEDHDIKVGRRHVITSDQIKKHISKEKSNG